MIRRILIGGLAMLVLAAGAFVGYGWLTRRGAPSFERGGAFGAPTPTAAASVAGRTRTARAPGAPAPDGRHSETAPAPIRPPAEIARTIAVPATGTYTYEGTGREQVRFGPTSACGWDIEEVTAVVKRGAGGVVFDWTYSDQRLERHLMDYRARQVRLTYIGAAVTCLGVRQTSEDEYEPASVWVKQPWEVGTRWKQRTQAGERIEHSVTRIAARERITVPAGRFTAYRIESTTTFSGDSGGTHTSTDWFVPALGIDVKRISSTDATRGSARFTSEITLELASFPARH